MQQSGHQKRLLLFLFGFMLAFFFSMRVFNDGIPGWKHIITSDGRGYYAYLPALFIDQDLTFRKVAAREARLLGRPSYQPEYLVRFGDHSLNKYYSGEALLLLPFFLCGILCSWLSGSGVDGFSFFFQVFIGLGTLFYLFAGLQFLKKILDHFLIRRAVVVMTLTAILFGTNLFYYSLWQPTMSHVFSFFAINGFLWFAIQALQRWTIRSASLASLFFGLVCLIRPTNMIVLLLIPFLAENSHRLTGFFKAIRSKPGTLALPIGIFAVIISLQSLIWFLQTGHFVIWSYQNEGFHFSSPEIVNVLFSFRKGLFVYTPLLLLSVPGIILLFFRNKIQFMSVAVFLATGTYVISSWWNWYYGDGFGLRAFIDYYGVFAILIAMLLNLSSNRVVLAGLTMIILPFIALNFIQTWQYTHQVIQPNSMNAVKYKHIFMRTDSAVINCLGGNEEIADFAVNTGHSNLALASDFETLPEGWNPNTILETSRSFSGKHSGYLDSLHQFSPGIVIRAKRLGAMPATCFVTGEVMVWDSLAGASNGALVVLSMDSINPGENYWLGFRLNDVPMQSVKTWRKCTFSLMLPEMSNPERTLKIYIWNTKKKPMLVDDFRVRFYR
ncbi:MAG: hypothetical protein ACOYNC_07520 [Bacteroidales bacterium]